MAIVFPSSPVDLQVFNVSPGVSFVYRYNRWRPAPMNTALPKNLLINPSMQVSQQNGGNSSAANGFYPADIWLHSRGTATGQFSNYRQDTLSINGGASRLIASCTVAQAVVGVNEWAGWAVFIEGQIFADLLWGTAAAKQIVVRLGFAAPAGKWAFCIRNAANNRSYVCALDVSAGEANAWKEFSFAIPGCTDGVWATDNTAGANIFICYVAGTGLQAAPDVWTNSNAVGPTGMSNGMASAGLGFQLCDMGLYVDPYKTGVAPPWKMPTFTDELWHCQRYWYKAFGLKGLAPSTTLFNALNMEHPVPTRTGPSAYLIGSVKAFDGTNTPTITSISSNASNRFAAELNTAATPLVAGRSVSNYWVNQDTYIEMNARL